jgi:hypothetical protein
VSGPHFGGWEIYHLKGSPADPNRLYASQSSGWFGQMIQRSDDGGQTWEPVGNKFAYDGVPGHASVVRRHAASLGVQARLASGAVAHRSRHGLCRGRGRRAVPLDRRRPDWKELSGLRGHGTGPHWQPGAGGMCLHTIILDPSDPARIFIAISAAGAFRTDDGGKTWKPINRGLRSNTFPIRPPRSGHCVHHIAMHPSRPGVLFMQKHWDVMRSDDAGDNWQEVSGNLPTDFGFAIDVHAHEPETIYVVPIKSDSEHFPPDGKLRVYRSRTGGNEWEPLTKGLPQSNCYVNVLRDAMAVDSLEECGVYFGTPAGRFTPRRMPADSWTPIVRDLPPCFRSRCRRSRFVADPHLAWTRDFLLGVVDQFLPLGQPADRARNGEQDGKHLRLEAHGFVDDAGVEIDVGVELAGDEVVVGEGDALEFHGEIDLLVAAGDLEDFFGGPLDDAGAGIVVLVDAVAEAHELVVAFFDALDEGGNVFDAADLVQHLEHFLVGAAMQAGRPERRRQRRSKGTDRLRTADGAHGVGAEQFCS